IVRMVRASCVFATARPARSVTCVAMRKPSHGHHVRQYGTRAPDRLDRHVVPRVGATGALARANRRPGERARPHARTVGRGMARVPGPCFTRRIDLAIFVTTGGLTGEQRDQASEAAVIVIAGVAEDRKSVV